MNKLKIIPHLLITSVFLGLIVILAMTGILVRISAGETGGKHALLIAIQDYDYGKTGFNSLKGPVNDIKLTKGVLQERFGFQDKDFTILLNAQATHTGIEQAFTALIERVKTNDFVYIYYSGHGSQTADLNGDEARSGKDQTWVSYGSRSSHEKHQDNYDVLDDEINAWLASLYAKTTQVVFVSDSCHSATASRGFDLTRAVNDDARPHILGKRPYAKVTHHGIRVGAARDYESAIDFPREDGQYYGLFTWYWVQNLQKAQAGETWNNIFQRTYAQVTAERGTVQRPQMMGQLRKQVLGGGFIPQPPTISVRSIDDDWIELQAGSLSGVTKGSLYRLYKPQHPNPQSLPSLTITQVKPFTSCGEPEGTFQTGDLVVEESHVYQFTPIKVYLEADFPTGEDKPLLQAIQAAFQPDSYGTQPLAAYELTDNLSHAHQRLHLLRPKYNNKQPIYAKANDAIPKSFPEQPPELWVLTQEERLLYKDLKIPFDNPAKGIQSLQDNLKKLARVRELKALPSSHDSQFQVEVQAYLLSPVKSCSRKADCMELPNDLGLHRKTGPYSLPEIEDRILSKGEILTFTLHNKSKWDYYCYLINISPNKAISAIFPDPEERMEYARVNAGEKRELIEETGLMTEIVGEETIKFITSRYPIDIRLLEQPNIKSDLNPLEQLLVNAAHGERGRVSLRNDEWATGLVAFEVK